ncbi:PLD nuclease N-terminal domain-containing protein [Pseudomonas mangiferae]|uniref:PLDc_N domain-containing protein n=1 Tax=Pseudomonas mangiferae TaxID=2593654 RepID=A0A553H4F7_9PSED|nr:PLD nuclease N-terminal domain-containing protein [Pseudomonas mangiferae]TRX76650.1 PLDc_N domain-containing protein [Pseudomonas mangiferae]
MIKSLYGSVAGLIILLLDIWAIVSVVRSDASSGKKLLWSLAILIFPVLGLIAWGFAGPRGITPPSSSEHSK